MSNEDYPELVTAFLDGMAIEMKQSTKGLWDEVKWTYSRFGARNGNLNLILQLIDLTSIIIFETTET